MSLAVRYRVGQRLPMALRTPVADCRFFRRQMPRPVSSQPPPAAGDSGSLALSRWSVGNGPAHSCPQLCQGLSQPSPMGRLVRWPIRDTVSTPSTRVPGVSKTTSQCGRGLPPTVRHLVCRGWLAVCQLAVCRAPIAVRRLLLSRFPYYVSRRFPQAVWDSITPWSADCLLTHAVQSTGYLGDHSGCRLPRQATDRRIEPVLPSIPVHHSHRRLSSTVRAENPRYRSIRPAAEN